MYLPKYYIIKKDEWNPLWKKYLDWLNERNDDDDWIWSKEYYWYEWSLWSNWFTCRDNIFSFENNPKLITLEYWNECVNWKELKAWDKCKVISDSNHHWYTIWKTITLKDIDVELVEEFKSKFTVWDTIMLSVIWENKYEDEQDNPHGSYWYITHIENNTYTVKWSNWILNTYDEEDLSIIYTYKFKLWDIVKYKCWWIWRHYIITNIDWIRVALELLSTKASYTTTIDRIELIKEPIISVDVWAIDWDTIWTVTIDSKWNITNFNLITNNLNMKTEMNKILVEEFVTNKANRKSLKEMKTFIDSKVDLLKRISSRLDTVWERLNNIWYELDRSMDRSDIEWVEKLMSEFSDVKEYISNFLATEVRDVVDIKATEKFDVQKFFNN